MTGEITLRGRVLEIGGLKEKVLAAHRGGIQRVLLPADNAKDLREVPAVVRRALELIPVAHMDEVLQHALRDVEGLFGAADSAAAGSSAGAPGLDRRPQNPLDSSPGLQ